VLYEVFWGGVLKVNVCNETNKDSTVTGVGLFEGVESVPLVICRV